MDPTGAIARPPRARAGGGRRTGRRASRGGRAGRLARRGRSRGAVAERSAGARSTGAATRWRRGRDGCAAAGSPSPAVRTSCRSGCRPMRSTASCTTARGRCSAGTRSGSSSTSDGRSAAELSNGSRSTRTASSMTLVVEADEPMPATLGWHPWFRRSIGERSPQVRLRFEAGTMLVRDDEGMPRRRAGPADAWAMGRRLHRHEPIRPCSSGARRCGSRSARPAPGGSSTR